MHFFKVILIISLFFSIKTYADDESTAKKRLLDSVTSKLSSGLENLIKGEGESQVTITAGEDYHPEYSIATVRPLAPHPGVDAWFVQLQLNEHKIRGDGRISVNTGVAPELIIEFIDPPNVKLGSITSSSLFKFKVLKAS